MVDILSNTDLFDCEISECFPGYYEENAFLHTDLGFDNIPLPLPFEDKDWFFDFPQTMEDWAYSCLLSDSPPEEVMANELATVKVLNTISQDIPAAREACRRLSIELSKPPLIMKKETKESKELRKKTNQQQGQQHPRIPLRRTPKNRLIWTKELQKKFLYAVQVIGIDNAMPKNVLLYMNVDGLTRENVASHLQKYKLQVYKRQLKGKSKFLGKCGAIRKPSFMAAHSIIPTFSSEGFEIEVLD